MEAALSTSCTITVLGNYLITSENKPVQLIEFSSERSIHEGIIHLETNVGLDPLSRTVFMEFHVVMSNSRYNVLFSITTIQQLYEEMSTIRSHLQFPSKSGMATIESDYLGKDVELTADVENITTREI